MSDTSPARSRGSGAGPVLVFLFVAVLLVDVASIRLLGTRNGPPAVTWAPPGRSRPGETIEVLVATRDLPAGTVLAADQNLWVAKKVPKDGAAPGSAANAADLLNKRLTRAVRAGAVFAPGDLTGETITLPPDTDIVTIPFDALRTSGLVAPGSKVDVLATLRLRNGRVAVRLLANLLVVGIGTNGSGVASASVAVTDKQARALALAKARGCSLDLVPKRPDAKDEQSDLDDIVEVLENAPPTDPLPEPDLVPPMPEPRNPFAGAAPAPRPTSRGR